MAKAPSLCAVLPNYNDADSLEQSLDALIHQTVPFNRIIVVNDGSTDRSLEIVTRYAEQHASISVIDNGRNLGIMQAVNIGLKAAHEDFVYLVSANDRFNLQVAALAQQVLAQGVDVGLVAGKVCLHDTDNDSEKIFAPPLPARMQSYTAEDYRAVVRARNFSFYGGSVLVHREKAIAAGGFREEMQWHADWFLFALLASRHGFAYVPEVFGTVSVAAGQYSSAIFDWSRQSVVIDDYLRLLESDYPTDYAVFRAMALLPSYDAQALLLSRVQKYLTPLLLWRLLFYKPVRVFGRLLPYGFREGLRKYFRL
jgi:glycosyltransferase involved in cell wall biosynthesis